MALTKITDKQVTYKQGSAGSVVRNLGEKLREAVSVKDFGAVGDDTDETVKLQNALTAVAGRTLSLEPGKLYRSTEELVMQPGTVLDLNGSTLRFACVGAKRNLAVGSNCTVKNGVVENVVGTAGFEGTYQTPIVIGQYATLLGVNNVQIQNLSISTAMPGGNGIGIFGDSSGILIENITFPDSAYIGIPIIAHWSFDGGPSGPYLGTTTHPHNITIRNITCGALTYGSAIELGQSVVFLSACYNVIVSNVYAKSYRYGKLVTVYAGDWGFQFGTALEQSLGSGSITIENLYGQAGIGFEGYMKNPLEAVQKTWPSSVTVSNLNVLNYGSLDSNSRGAQVQYMNNCTIENSVMSGGYYSVYASHIEDFKISDNLLQNCDQGAIYFEGTTNSSNIEICNNRFSGNNVSAAASQADIYLDYVSQVSVKENVFDSSSCAWNIRAINTTTGLRCQDNHTVSLGAGPCYSFGGASDTAICVEFKGNTSAVAPTNGFRGGQLMIPVAFSSRFGQSSLQRIAYFTTAPDRGAWGVGDRVYCEVPVVGQPKSWVCTVAGTPGTWVSEGNL